MLSCSSSAAAKQLSRPGVATGGSRALGRACYAAAPASSFHTDAKDLFKTRRQQEIVFKPGGRSHVSGVTATVFGSSGFLARYVINRFGKIGSQVIVPFRGDGMNVRHLKVMGDTGQIVHIPMDIRDVDSVRRAVEQSNVVVNCIGIDFPTRNFSFNDTHNLIPARIAQVCQEAGVSRLVHLSALGASEDSDSEFLRSKARGEKSVLAEFPEATIVRPSAMFGHEDRFINLYAQLAALTPFVVPIANGGAQLIHPVFVEDVADAIVKILSSSSTKGKVFELGGPEEWTLRGLVEKVCETTQVERGTVNVPDAIARLYGKVFQLLPEKWRLFSEEDIVRMHTDLVVTPRASVHTFEDLKFHTTPLSQMLKHLLLPYTPFRDLVM